MTEIVRDDCAALRDLHELDLHCLKELFRKCHHQMARRWITGDLRETWSHAAEAPDAAEAAACTYEQMVRRWIMVDLGNTWSEVTQAAGGAEAAARAYQQAKEDPSRTEGERLQARNEIQTSHQATL